MFRLGAALRHIDTGVRLDVGGELLCCARFDGHVITLLRFIINIIMNHE